MNFGREERFETKNQLPLYAYRSEGLHGFCLCVYARAGVLYETPNEVGVSHFVEHIVFRNIDRLYDGKLYDLLDGAGLTFSAATYKEFMQFCITGATAHFSLAADIMTKLFEPLSPHLRGEIFEAERGRIRAEIREYDEKSSLEYVTKHEVWRGTPLENMITGTLGGVSRLTHAACERARREIFASDNCFFYVTGKFDADDLRDLTEKIERYSLYEPIGRRNRAPVPRAFCNRPKTVLLRDSSYYMVEMCFDVDMMATEKPTRTLFYDRLFAGENCLFFKELSERSGYIYSYDAKLEEYGHAGNLSVSYEVARKDLEKSLEKAIELFERIKDDASGLSLSKAYYTENACLLLDNAEDLNWTMAYENHILEDRSESISTRKERYERVTEENICRLARDIFKRSNLVIGIKGRKKHVDIEAIETILARLK